MSPSERVAVVTGASRGAGKGIALSLARPGTTVYVTGRTTEKAAHPLGGSLRETAAAIDERGGKGVPVVCDHADDAQVGAVFEQVKREQGRLDILVNNACAIPRELPKKGPFWDKSLDLLRLLDVGMRSHYVATWYAAPILVETGGGVVAFTSSFGGRCYMHGPAYGAGKAAVDKMAMDMAVDFRPFDVASISLWLGMVRTERNEALMGGAQNPYAKFLESAESPEFAGRVIDALHADPKRMERSGRVLIAAELAEDYGIEDIDGKRPASNRRELGDPPEPNPAIVR